MPGIYELVMAVFFVAGGLFLGFLITGGDLLTGVTLAIVFLLLSALYYKLGQRDSNQAPA